MLYHYRATTLCQAYVFLPKICRENTYICRWCRPALPDLLQDAIEMIMAESNGRTAQGESGFRLSASSAFVQ
jgi:hypothetical protein